MYEEIDKKFDYLFLKLFPSISFAIGLMFGVLMSFIDQVWFTSNIFINLLLILFCGLISFVLYFGLFGMMAIFGTVIMMSKF